VLARALRGRRDQVVIATKFNSVFDETTRQVSGADCTPPGIRKACEDSLRRLESDYIDLYQFHDNGYPADQAGPVRDTLEELVRQGKIRAYGWSTDFADRARAFAEGQKCASIQLQLNVLDDNPEVLAVCEENNLAAINRGPLAMGLLTGTYTATTKPAANDVRGEKSPEWMKYFKNGRPSPEWLQKRDAIREILTRGGRSVSQGAIGWLWARSGRTIPIPGFRTVKQVEENAAALNLGALGTDQMSQIAKILGR
jgi:aryl-alcohol dehydrogenase-like predicted oxidoreductase